MSERILTPAQSIERSIIKTYRVDIWNKFVMGVKRYKMINENDRIAVCVSGGKDSMLMAKCIQHLQKFSDVKFELEYIFMDTGKGEDITEAVKENAEYADIPLTIFKADEKQNTDDRLENLNGLYRYAKSLGCNKIALGHHFDDVIENNIMGMIYGGYVKGMMPKLKSKDFEGMELIRPLFVVKEADIKRWVNYSGVRLADGACYITERFEALDGEGSVPKKQEIKELMERFRKTNPNIENNIFKSVYNVNLRTIVAYEYNGEKHNFLDDYDDYDWEAERRSRKGENAETEE